MTKSHENKSKTLPLSKRNTKAKALLKAASPEQPAEWLSGGRAAPLHTAALPARRPQPLPQGMACQPGTSTASPSLLQHPTFKNPLQMRHTKAKNRQYCLGTFPHNQLIPYGQIIEAASRFLGWAQAWALRPKLFGCPPCLVEQRQSAWFPSLHRQDDAVLPLDCNTTRIIPGLYRSTTVSVMTHNMLKKQRRGLRIAKDHLLQLVTKLINQLKYIYQVSINTHKVNAVRW